MRIFLLILFAYPVLACSQEKSYGSVYGEIKLPTTTANKNFQRIFDGVIDFSLIYQLPEFKNFGIGLGGNYLYLKANELAINIKNLNLNGRLHRFTPFAKFYYQQKTSKTILEAYIKTGGSLLYYESNYCQQQDIQSKENGFYLEPGLAAHLFADENMAIGFIVSYAFQGNEFTAEDLCLTTFPGTSESDAEGISQHFAVGFTFTAFIEKRR